MGSAGTESTHTRFSGERKGVAQRHSHRLASTARGGQTSSAVTNSSAPRHDLIGHLRRLVPFAFAAVDARRRSEYADNADSRQALLLESVEALGALIGEAEAVLYRVTNEAHEAGLTWRAIGDVLNMSGREAQRRWNSPGGRPAKGIEGTDGLKLATEFAHKLHRSDGLSGGDSGLL